MSQPRAAAWATASVGTAGPPRQRVAEELGAVLALDRGDRLLLGDGERRHRRSTLEQVHVVGGEGAVADERREQPVVEVARHDPHHGPPGAIVPGAAPRSRGRADAHRLLLGDEPARPVEAAERQGGGQVGFRTGLGEHPAVARRDHGRPAEETGEPLAQVLQATSGQDDADQDLVRLLDPFEDAGLLVEHRPEDLGDDPLGLDGRRGQQEGEPGVLRLPAPSFDLLGGPPGDRDRCGSVERALLDEVLTRGLPRLYRLGVGADEVVAGLGRGPEQRRAQHTSHGLVGVTDELGSGQRGQCHKAVEVHAADEVAAGDRCRGRRWQLRLNHAAIIGNIHHEPTVIAVDSVAGSVRHNQPESAGPPRNPRTGGDPWQRQRRSGRQRSPSAQPCCCTDPFDRRSSSAPSLRRSTSAWAATPRSFPS